MSKVDSIAIAGVKYEQVSPRATICIITLVSGFEVYGRSSCLDPSRFDWEIGKQWAYKDALSKYEELEGFYIAQKQYEEEVNNG